MEKSDSPGTYTGKRQKLSARIFEDQTNPSVLHCLSPTFSVLADANDHIQTVVTSIQALAMSLRTIANEGERVIFEVVLKFCQRPITALVHNFF